MIQPDGGAPELLYDPSQRNVLLASFLDAANAPQSLDCGVHRKDEMFAYALAACQNSFNDALVMYHQGGALGYRIVDQLLDGIAVPSSWLDFGCGYGRVLRYARADRPDLDIVGCEIDGRAAEFVASRYDVRGLQSSTRPGDLDLPEEVALITAWSVFTHLPEAEFIAWLERLWHATAPGGILAVSTNDLARMPMGVGRPGTKFVFERHSESDLLSSDDYGTTWVAADWMRSAMRRIAGDQLADLDVLERGLWNAQDLWVARKASGGGQEQSVPAMQPAPIGYLEGLEIRDARRVKVEGWCLACAERAPRLLVEIVDESCRVLDRHDQSEFSERPDLLREFGSTHRGGSWSVDLESERPLRGTEILRLVVDDLPVHVSLLDAADRRVRTERRIHELEVGQRILKDELERKGGLPLRLARAVLRRLKSR